MKHLENALVAAFVIVAIVVRVYPYLAPSPPDAFGCTTGTWQLVDNRFVSIGPDESDRKVLRWRTPDGQTGRLIQDGETWTSTIGWTNRPDTITVKFGNCEDGLTLFNGLYATRVEFDITDTTFLASDGTMLSGRLVMPKMDGWPDSTKITVIVDVPGDEKRSAKRYNALQQILPSLYVGVFVYDRRGTGESKGRHSRDLYWRTQDAVAAIDVARSLAGDRLKGIGVHGTGTATWVVPEATNQSRSHFFAVSNGSLLTPLQENRSRILHDIARAGYDTSAQRAAGEIVDAIGTVLTSQYDSGFTKLDSLKKQYRSEPWYSHVQGPVTEIALKYPGVALRFIGPALEDLQWGYDPLPLVKAMNRPMLWLFAKDDRVSPPDTSIQIVKELHERGKQISLLVAPGADRQMVVDHQMIVMEEENGVRVGVRYMPAYYWYLVKFAGSDAQL